MTNSILPVSGAVRRKRTYNVMPKACKHCPSAHFPPDPESEDIRDHFSRSEQLDTLFACGWGDGRLCRGYCDFLNVTDEERAALSGATS